MIDFTQALKSLYSDCRWEQHGYDYDGLVWHEKNIPKPTEAELTAECERLEILNAHVVPRRNEYPSIEKQLDTLYHGGYDAWKAEITAIKNKYPKAT
jgi:hypothetical protein